MIFAVPTQPDVPRYRPAYEEIVSEGIAAQYRATEKAMLDSREGSEYLRREFSLLEALRRLRSLAALRPNWDSYGSDAPATNAIKQSRRLVEALIDEGLSPDGILPSAEGGVAICFLRNAKHADIECLNSGEILAVRYSGGEDPIAWAVGRDLGATQDLIGTLSGYLSA